MKQKEIATTALLSILLVGDRDDSTLMGLLEDIKKQDFQNFCLVTVSASKLKLSKDLCTELNLVKSLEGDHKDPASLINNGLAYIKEHKLSPFVLILNPPLRIPESHWLTKMFLTVARGPYLVASMALDASNEVLYSEVKISKVTGEIYKSATGQNYFSVEKNDRECDALFAKSMIFPRSMIEEIGFMKDKVIPKFGMGLEWSIRAKKKGYKLLMVRDVFTIEPSITEDQAVSGRSRYSSEHFSKIKDLLNRDKAGSLPVIYSFSNQAYDRPYNYIYSCMQTLCRVFNYLFRMNLAEDPVQAVEEA